MVLSVNRETLRRNEELNRKVLQEYEDMRETARKFYRDIGRLSEYEAILEERRKQEARSKEWEKWSPVIVFAVIWLVFYLLD